MWVAIFLVRTWGTFWYQNYSDLLNFFDFEFSTPPASVNEAMHVSYGTQRHQKKYDVTYDVTCLALWRWINFFLSVSPDSYKSCRLIQVFCHKYSFVFFYFIVIRLEAWLTNWLTVNLPKKYKIKRKFTFFSKYQIYFISWVENIKIFICAVHSWKFWCFQHTRRNIFGIHFKKVNILYLFIYNHIIFYLSCFFFNFSVTWK